MKTNSNKLPKRIVEFEYIEWTPSGWQQTTENKNRKIVYVSKRHFGIHGLLKTVWYE